MTAKQEAGAWLKERMPDRRLIHHPGKFDEYATSKVSTCWGQPNEGNTVRPGLAVSVCQPGRLRENDPLVAFWDFKETPTVKQHAISD